MPIADRAQSVEWAAWQMHCLLQPLQEFARYEIEKQNRAPTSTTLAGLQASLKRLGGHLPSSPPTPEQVTAALEQALRPPALPVELQEVKLQVEVVGLRPGPEFYPRLVVRLRASESWTLHCFDCAGLDGPWKLSEATASLLPNGILLTGSEGVLKCSGTCIVVPGFSEDLRSPIIENAHSLPQTVVQACQFAGSLGLSTGRV